MKKKSAEMLFCLILSIIIIVAAIFVIITVESNRSDRGNAEKSTEKPVLTEEPGNTDNPPEQSDEPGESAAPSDTEGPENTPTAGREVALESFKTDNSFIVIYDDEYMEIRLTCVPENTTETFLWTSEDEKIAKVSQTGMVYGVSEGVTYVHCNASGGLSQKVKVTIKHRQKSTPTPTPKPTGTAAPAATLNPTITEKYINQSGNTVATRVKVPDGYTRVTVPEDSFGAFLRNLELEPFGKRPKLYNGTDNISAPYYAVIKETIPNWDIQQCADTIMRLWAEYLYSQKRYDEIYFDLYSDPAFRCDYLTWALGQRLKIVDNKHTWYMPENGGEDYSEGAFRKYLEYIYSYANTDSLKTQCQKVSLNDLKIGDIIVASNTELRRANPNKTFRLGHAVLIADMAVNAKGEKIYLIIQGNTPATEPYVILSGNNFGGIWTKFEGGYFVTANGVKFPADSFRRLG